MLGQPYTINDIAAYTMAKDLHQGYHQQIPLKYVSFDTRTIRYGSQTVFIALNSGHRDGHEYIPDAIEKGIRNFIVDRPLRYSGINYALVSNTLDALQLWAYYHRARITYPIIGITGSNGKTTLKEWLSTLIEWDFELIKSPLSYNSQMGVPISLLRLSQQAELGIIEAGISQQGEMELLEQMIRPQIGILTHMGDAHADGFTSIQQKLEEKCLLFKDADTLLASSRQAWVAAYLEAKFPQVKFVGDRPDDFLQIVEVQQQEGRSNITLQQREERVEMVLHATDPASVENALLAILAARILDVAWDTIISNMASLHAINMRTEIITDNPEITIINDTYNSDLESILNSFHLLNNISNHSEKFVILSDLFHQGKLSPERHQQVYNLAMEMFGQSQIFTIGPKLNEVSVFQNFSSVNDFLTKVPYNTFRNATVLIKGARAFEMERLIPFLNHKRIATFLEIDLKKLIHNYRVLTSYIPQGTKTMCVVKASSYGSGTWEIAQELENEGVTYLAVAYTSEGIDLRNSQIQIPIMVMNPDIESIPSLIQYDLEPEVSNITFLKRFLREARWEGISSYRIHLKFETGMGRLGFVKDELAEVCKILQSDPHFSVISVMSHLAAADDPASDPFSRQQVEVFLNMYHYLQQELGITPLRHILNSKGVLRFPEYAFEMVRLGAGLYGINTTGTKAPLEEIGTLVSTISQIRAYPAQVSIGYGRSQYTQQVTRIATVALGYADGVPRNLSNGNYTFLVRGKEAPIFGRVCMDMTMIDVTHIPEAQSGDEVLVFGVRGEYVHTIDKMAKQAETIPYEILVRISARVRRIYTK